MPIISSIQKSGVCVNDLTEFNSSLPVCFYKATRVTGSSATIKVRLISQSKPSMTAVPITMTVALGKLSFSNMLAKF